MRTLIALLLDGLSADRAVANVCGDLADLERALASVDAIAARLAARVAYEDAA